MADKKNTSSLYKTLGDRGWQTIATIGGALGILLLLGFYYLYAADTSSAHETQKVDIAKQEAENKRAREVRDNKPVFLTQFAEQLDNYGQALKFLPREGDVNNILQTIQQLAKSKGLTIVKFDANSFGQPVQLPPALMNSTAVSVNGAPAGGGSIVAPPAGAPAPAAVPAAPTGPIAAPTVLYARMVPSQLTGTHAAFTSFLADLAVYERIIHVKDIKIIANKTGSGQTIDLTVVAFYAPKPADLPTVPPELQTKMKEIESGLTTSGN